MKWNLKTRMVTCPCAKLFNTSRTCTISGANQGKTRHKLNDVHRRSEDELATETALAHEIVEEAIRQCNSALQLSTR